VQVAAERTVLHTQLAAANNEITLLRDMAGSMEGLRQQQQQHELVQQQRQQLESQAAELGRLRQELQVGLDGVPLPDARPGVSTIASCKARSEYHCLMQGQE